MGQEQRDDNENLYREMLDNIDSGIYFIDKNRTITFWNIGAEHLTGFTADEVVGRNCQENILNHVDEEGCHLCMGDCPMKLCCEDGLIRQQNVYLHHKDGYRLKVRVKALPIRENGEIVGAIELFEKIADNSSQKDMLAFDEKNYSMEELKMLALYDQLTGLPNRRYLDSIFQSRFYEHTNLGLSFGVLFIDIDNFRDFNNLYGHDMGDRVLKMVSTTYTSAIRKTDIIGRWGGEEFVGVFSMVSKDELQKIGEKIRMLVENSIIRLENGEELHVTISVGGTIIGKEDSIASVTKRADEAMYLSKANGKNQVTMI